MQTGNQKIAIENEELGDFRGWPIVARRTHRCRGKSQPGRTPTLVHAQCSTIRLKVLKIGALIRISVRKVWVSLAGGYPYVTLFRQVYEKLCAVPIKY